jgi:hypothetical protein
MTLTCLNHTISTISVIISSRVCSSHMTCFKTFRWFCQHLIFVQHIWIYLRFKPKIYIIYTEIHAGTLKIVILAWFKYIISFWYFSEYPFKIIRENDDLTGVLMAIFSFVGNFKYSCVHTTLWFILYSVYLRHFSMY